MARQYRRWPPASLAVFIVLALLIALRAGWDAGESSPAPDFPSSSEPVPSAPSSPEPSQEPADKQAGVLVEGPAKVVRVVDGDTLILRQAGEQYRVRLLGVDTPETVKEDTTVQQWGPEATEFTNSFVRQGEVRVELDKRRVDRFGRSLAYVYVGEKMLNVELVRAGLARVAHYPGDSQAMLRLLRQAESEARSERRGIWSQAEGRRAA